MKSIYITGYALFESTYGIITETFTYNYIISNSNWIEWSTIQGVIEPKNKSIYDTVLLLVVVE